MQTVPAQKSEIDRIESKPYFNTITKYLHPAFGIRDGCVYTV